MDEPLDLGLVTRDCYCAILNGTHATTVQVLLAGRPVLLLPLTLEQHLLANRVAALGAGVAVNLADPKDVFRQMANILNEDRHVQAAAEFASLYAAFDPQLNVQRWTLRILDLL